MKEKCEFSMRTRIIFIIFARFDIFRSIKFDM